MLWLTENHQLKIKKKFEPLYGRALTDAEVLEIANNLVKIIEVWSKQICQKTHSKPKT